MYKVINGGNSALTNSQADTSLANVQLVAKDKYEFRKRDLLIIPLLLRSIKKVPFEKGYVLMNNFTGNAKVKEGGVKVNLPLISSKYLVSLGTFNVKVLNPENNKGRYEQNVGVGEDISLSLKIKFKISKENMGQFIREQETWKNAVKTSTEKIMRLTLEDNQTRIQNLCNSSQINDIRIPDVDLNNPTGSYASEIENEARELKINYGIDLLKVSFIDIDLPERLKQAKIAEIEAAKQREILEKNAAKEREIKELDAAKQREIRELDALNERNIREKDAVVQRDINFYDALNDVSIAEQRGIAAGKEVDEIVSAFRARGYTNTEIIEYLKLKKLADSNANVIYGTNGATPSTPIILNTDGRSK